ncbi:sigma-70 family RNA polymerase sigma factor [Aneurinibacillus aneurinilyticus]|uniref:Sigma-70 family RNA polymerase sigma factor n=2 Tax=Aneurinibacillus aneurinilyticus TaxID=1391 RepID=A0A848CWZ3_ANEAE|nr:sigma-70 family RNA polymerase sigma factor [Aneurinibacillus aneurinilyticus]ERI07123.1 Sigma-70 region 2 [Aneurinibacillus aneurinilyticus ATCC 12856]MCI1693469.1 sigma-70 family RNA polymerase sigma factor [Aneurinibacillus aneurinilyticus]MED0672528.1 sigma-70 family RNA polymerase sigma factor [Aneurinibacillus aneurinilyticus]MED0704533.1 sigma-70 family RNA polymerase sigma factor [Aneurinibacillus aneurinilyticus]MED0725159.1 sigma-70 family RNA polymerase sigma factor [Aneurinibaci
MEDDIKQAKNGNQEAFIRLIKINQPSLYRVSKAIVKTDEDCADAIQETILKAYHAIHTLREPNYFKTWLIRILINECKRILQRKKHLVSLIELKQTQTTTDDYGQIEIQEIVDSLEEELRIIVILYYFDDLPIKKISQILDQPIGTVKSRLHRARLKLANLFELPNDHGKELMS